jgi:hypothetical protein
MGSSVQGLWSGAVRPSGAAALMARLRRLGELDRARREDMLFWNMFHQR